MRRTLLADFETPIDADFIGGVDEARDRVEKFVREKIVENPELEGDVHLSLAQLGTGSSMSIQSWLFCQGDDASAMAAGIVDVAMEDGSAAGNGKVKYQVTIKGHTGRCAFALDYKPRTDDDSDEVPNAQGIVAQALKQNQTLHHLVVDMVRDSRLEHKEQRKEDLNEIRALRSGQIETIQTLAALYDAKHARDLETKKLEKAEGRKDEVAGMLMQGIPAVVNKLMGGGKPVLEEKTTPLEQMLYGFLSTFTQEQLQTTVQTGQINLQHGQMLGLLEIFKAVQEKASRAQGAPPPTQNGTAGAASHAPSPETGG